MKGNVKQSLLMSFAFAALTASVAAAQTSQITDEHVQELIRMAAERAGVSSQAGAPLPQSTPGGTAEATPVLALTLDDAIKLALDRNLDIAVQRLNPETFDYSIASLQSVYKPTLTSTLSRNSQTDPSRSTTQGSAAGIGITQGTNTYNGGLSQNFKWGGGQFAATFNNNKQTTTSATTLFNPAFNTNFSAQFTQPLMRNFKVDNTRQQLVVTKLNQDISEIQLQALIINTVSSVRNAYWDYVFATQAVEVARRSVELAEQLVKDNQMRVEIGTMAPIDIVQAQSQAATQRQNIATAEGTRRTAELTLKRLIVNGTADPNWNSTIDPTDRPDFVPATIDVAAAVRRALENRTDLQQARKNLQVNDVTLSYLRNQTMPQVDVVGRYQLAGQGGTRFERAGTGVTGTITNTIPGGYIDALSTLLNGNYPTWTVSLNVAYPLGTSQADATVARARVQQRQVEAQLKQIELQIATDVTNAATQVQNNIERVQAAQVAREFSQRQLEAEQSKFEVGMQTNYFVVQAQRDLATAQNNELSAVLAYRRSLVELERLQQTSLSNSNITILGR